MLVVERCPHTFLFVCPEVNKSRQALNSCPVGKQLRVSVEQAVCLCQEIHVVQKLKQNEVHVCHIVAHTECLCSDKSFELSSLLIDKVLELLRISKSVRMVT